jgi:hypothetical protein
MISTGEMAEESGTYECDSCGHEMRFLKGQNVPACSECGNITFNEPGELAA